MDLADKLKMALDEGRLLILGAQVVFGCQFQMVFQEGFQDVPRDQSGRAWNRPAGAYACGRLITPSMTHQVTYRGEDRKGALRVATRCAGLAMLPMTLGLGSTTFVVFESLFNRNIGIVAGITFAAVAVEITGKPVFVRELLPQDLKIEMNALDRKEAARVAGYLAAVVGEAHGRQMQGNDRRAWYKELRRNRAKALMRPRGSGGASSISSLSISAAILSTAVRCLPPADFSCRTCSALYPPRSPNKTVLPQQVIAEVSQSIWDRPGIQSERIGGPS
jgi:Family of unknown function (DUF6328)/Uncharacterized protein conserved in bacteria (DUF2252)